MSVHGGADVVFVSDERVDATRGGWVRIRSNASRRRAATATDARTTMSSGKAALVRALKSANETLKNGDASEALRLANEAVAMDENAYEAWVVRGKCAAANGDADDAVTSYERAIGIKSDHPAAYQGLSETLEAKGDVEGRLRATRLLADATRASGKIEKYYEFMK